MSAPAPRKTINAYLIFRAGDQSLRIVKSRPALAWDELAFPTTLTIPAPWGRLAGSILIDLPDNGPAVVEVQQPQQPEAKP